MFQKGLRTTVPQFYHRLLLLLQKNTKHIQKNLLYKSKKSQWHFSLLLFVVLFLPSSSRSHRHQYSTSAAKQAGPFTLYLRSLHHWIEKNTDDNVVFCPLPVSNNMLVIIIGFTILGLFFYHPLSSVNNKNWLRNYYSGLCNGADSRSTLFLTTGYDL